MNLSVIIIMCSVLMNAQQTSWYPEREKELDNDESRLMNTVHQLAKISAQNIELRHKVDAIERELKESVTKTEGLQQDLDHKSAELKACKEDVGCGKRLNADLDRYKRKLDKKDQKLKKKKEKLDQETKKWSYCEDELNQTSQNLDFCEDELDSTKQTFESTKQALDRCEDELDEKVQNLNCCEDELKSTKQSLELAEQSLESTEQSLNLTKQSVVEIEAELKKMEKNWTNCKDDVINLNKNLTFYKDAGKILFGPDWDSKECVELNAGTAVTVGANDIRCVHAECIEYPRLDQDELTEEIAIRTTVHFNGRGCCCT